MKTNGHKTKAQGSSWLQRAWPEAAEVQAQLREKAFSSGAVDARTKALIQLACVSLLRCKHCVDGTLSRLKEEHKVSDREIAEVMLVASYAAAGTNMAWAKEVFEQHIG